MPTRIAKAAIAGKAKVFMANGPATIEGVDSNLYKSLDLNLNVLRIRDFGPIGMIKNRKVVIGNPVTLAVNSNDDEYYAGLAKLTSYSQQKIPLIFNRDYFMLDSNRNLFTTKEIYKVNAGRSKPEVDDLLRKHLGVEKVHVLPTDGLFAKLLNDHTVLISMEDEAGNGVKTMEYFKSINAPGGKKYTILTVKGWTNGICRYTYTDSVLVNNIAIVPSFEGHKEYEQSTVKKIYKDALPGVRVIFVPSDEAAMGCQSIRSQTKTIPSLDDKEN